MALNPQRSSLLTKKATNAQGKTSFTDNKQGFFDRNPAVKSTAQKESIKLIQEGVLGFVNYEAVINSSKQLEFNAKQEEIIGEQQGLAALEALNDAQAANVVAAFASGIRLQGSVTRAQTELSMDQALITMIAKTNADIKAGALEREARRRRAEAKYNRDVGPLKIIAGGVLAYFTGGQV